MSEAENQPVFEALKRRRELKDVPDSILKEVAAEWEPAPGASGPTRLSELMLDELSAIALRRASLCEEERAIRAKLAIKLGTHLDDLEAIVKHQFEGATRDIAERHFEAVRQERTRRITQGILDALGGKPNSSLEDILGGAARAVADSVKPPREGAATAQIAQAVSQAVQQVALNVQKIITVALENERSSDVTNPRYYYP